MLVATVGRVGNVSWAVRARVRAGVAVAASARGLARAAGRVQEANGFSATEHDSQWGAVPVSPCRLVPRMGGPSTLLHALECMDHLVPHHAFVYRTLEKKKLPRAAVCPRGRLSRW
mgnify:CR=1 FL=1